MEEPPREEWAWKTWPLLALAARVHMILTYDDVQELTGMAKVGVGPNCLGPIAAYCIINKIPVLPCLVVGLDDGLPAEGLLKHIPADRIPAEQQKCFKFNWGNLDKPTVEQLRDAYDQMGFGKGEAA